MYSEICSSRVLFLPHARTHARTQETIGSLRAPLQDPKCRIGLKRGDHPLAKRVTCDVADQIQIPRVMCGKGEPVVLFKCNVMAEEWTGITSRVDCAELRVRSSTRMHFARSGNKCAL